MKDKPSLTPGEQGVIQRFKQKAKDFWAMWETLEGKETLASNAPAKLQDEYEGVMNRGIKIRKSVEKATSMMDGASSLYNTSKEWLADKFGLGGLPGQCLGMNPTLGAIPALIPIAFIGVSLAAMGKWMKDAYVLNKRLNVYANLVKKGVPAKTAAGMVDKIVGSGSLFSGAFKIGAPLILAGVAALLYLNRGRM